MEQLTEKRLREFQTYLIREERSPGSIEKYMRDVYNFAAFLKGRPVTRELAAEWRDSLLATRTPRTVNAMLAAVNALFRFAGWEDCRVKYFKLQRQVFRSSARELTRQEYEQLLKMARACNNQRLSLLMETICSTGIRVSEVKYITVEAVKAGQATVSLKGKIRVILLPGKLCRKLLKYAAKQKTASGEIFLTRN